MHGMDSFKRMTLPIKIIYCLYSFRKPFLTTFLV